MTKHAMFCEKCREELATHSVIKSILISGAGIEADEHCEWEEVRLVNQVRARIQTARESGLSTWESAVISIRGWLVGFAAVAILLLALSGQLATRKSVIEKGESPEQISSTITPMIEDLISSNIQPGSEEGHQRPGVDQDR
ncbi:MAG: hypothetical protein AAB401_01770, partial [Acidobacteriota bacterium]